MILFEIVGDPIPQKQTRFTKQGHIYDPSLKNKNTIQWQIKPYAPKVPFSGPIRLDITFFFQPPKSTSFKMRRQMLNHIIHHIKKPDADNCAYIITNAMKKIFYNDDSQIIDLSIHKRYHDTARTVVCITELEEIAPTRGEDVSVG